MRSNIHMTYGLQIVIISIIIIVDEIQTHPVEGGVSNVNEFYGNLIETNLNSSVDPCEDFYAYACGNWHRSYNASSEYIDMPGYMDTKVNQQFRGLMEHQTDAKWKSGVYGKAKDLYESCEQLDTLVLNSFLMGLHEELEMQWPIFALEEGEWKNISQFDWLRVTAVLRRYGLNNIFITHNVNVNPRNSSEYYLELAQHHAHTILEAEDVENIFLNFGLSHNESHSLTEELLQFERILNELAKYQVINETDKKNYADNFHILTLKELQASVPQVDWLKYFQIVLNTTQDLQQLKVQTFAWDAKFFANLKDHLDGYGNDTIAYYLMLKFMYHVNGDLPHRKQRNCIRYLRSFMPVFMNFLYEEHYFKDKRVAMEKSLNKMFNNLKKSFESLVEENHLKLNKKEQHFILKELHGMQLKVGNLPRNCTEHYVEAFYQTLSINRSDFVQSHLNILRFTNQLHYKNLKANNASVAEKVYNLDATTQSSSSPVKIFENAILIPHGYLQLPLYDLKLSHIHQYSLLGVILAHEIIHAYDLFHIVYDYRSNYDYLGSQVGHHYTPHMHCFANSPTEIISENIADVSGLRMAYHFYRTLEEDLEFPLFHLTKDQYFFVNSVQFLCGDLKQISDLALETTDLGHDMHDLRMSLKHLIVSTSEHLPTIVR
ncbi:phosphate-regulating neutral endopeptidase PHEX [Stomoxys calcitrans]|uniref:phosphate-regulating neutral endopeptidase PHEX n=1 Tax=Stomoxys calcitrans TaxID=35570 RepID=UPI0027E3AA3E|nr:phosphate-regulating neutral endopeptidase PHEX [Stomoxys calcitrans]